MASTNIIQFNPTEANQENDAEYLADAQRAGGAAVDAAFPSALANKLFYQTSTMCTAIANAMVTKGVSASDSDVATLSTNFLDAFNIVQSIDTTVYTASSSSTSAQNLSLYTSAAGVLNRSGRVLRITACGNIIGLSGAQTIFLGMTFGGGVGATPVNFLTISPSGSFSGQAAWELVVKIATTNAGSSGGIVISGSASIAAGGATIPASVGGYLTNLTFNTTDAITVQTTVQFSVASTSNTATQAIQLVEGLY